MIPATNIAAITINPKFGYRFFKLFIYIYLQHKNTIYNCMNALHYFHLFHIFYTIDIGDDRLQFDKGMNFKMDVTIYNFIHRICLQTIYRQMKFVGDAIDQVSQKMEPVYGLHRHAHGIKTTGIIFKFNRLHGISFLSRPADSQRTVSFMDGNRSVFIDKPYHLIQWQRITMRTSVIL